MVCLVNGYTFSWLGLLVWVMFVLGDLVGLFVWVWLFRCLVVGLVFGGGFGVWW